MRTAESVVFTCCPPAPDARNVSMRTSDGLISTSMVSSTSGYTKTLANQERVFFPIEGFSGDPKDYDIRIENRKLGAGMRITGDRPLASATLWSIRSVLSVEPFIDVTAEPGKDFSWKYTYAYYTIPKGE